MVRLRMDDVVQENPDNFTGPVLQGWIIPHSLQIGECFHQVQVGVHRLGRVGFTGRQAGILAAAGIYALEHHVTRLKDDHDNAQMLAQKLSRVPGIALNPEKVQTNIVIFSVKPSGLSSADFLSQISSRGVLAVPVDRDRVRMVTHLDVSRRDVESAADIVASVLGCPV